jgi:hypothetical protein
MNPRTDRPLTTLTPMQTELLNVLDHRFWPGIDLEAALRIDSTERRMEMYSALGLLRRAHLVMEVPSQYSGRLYMITERGMVARHDSRLRQLTMLIAEREEATA